MITDTAFYRYSHYHRQTDTPEKLNYPAMARVVMGAGGGAWHPVGAVSVWPQGQLDKG